MTSADLARPLRWIGNRSAQRRCQPRGNREENCMSDALPAISRRTFISVSTLAGVATAAPLAASTIAWSGPLAIASPRSAIPAGWQGSATVLAGDYFQRLGQIRIALATSVGRKLALFLDGADE